jgi:hypothetical protein
MNTELRARASAMTDRELVSWLGIWEQVRHTDSKFARVARPSSPAWIAPEPDAASMQAIIRQEMKQRAIAKGG